MRKTRIVHKVARRKNALRFFIVFIKNQRWLLFSPWHLKWIKSYVLLLQHQHRRSPCPLEAFCRDTRTQHKRKKSRKKNESLALHVFAIVSLEATLALFSTAAAVVVIGRTDLFYSPEIAIQSQCILHSRKKQLHGISLQNAKNKKIVSITRSRETGVQCIPATAQCVLIANGCVTLPTKMHSNVMTRPVTLSQTFISGTKLKWHTHSQGW